MSHFKLIKEIVYHYEDDDIIVVSKPSGLLSVPDRFKKISNLKDELLKKYSEVYTVQKLDRETSGILIFAKNEETFKYFNGLFGRNEVEQIFWAFVQNTPEIESGIIEVPILNDLKKSGRMHINADGKPALTKFKLIENYGKFSIVALFPVTGRTHQTRVHSKYMGCPLIVDPIYSRKENFFLSEVKRSYKVGEYEDERPFIKRLTLHAKSLKFIHPNGKEMFFENELPKDLRALKKQLDKLLK